MPDDDPEPEGKVGEAPARDNKEEQKAEQEAAADKVHQTPDSEAKNKRRAGIFSRPGLDAGPRAGARG